MQEEDEKLTRLVIGVVVKSILIICITIVAVLWRSSCSLNTSTIETCNSACSKYGSAMESVTSSECVCIEKKSILSNESMWVIPRKK
jgi:hypothetical protein